MRARLLRLLLPLVVASLASSAAAGPIAHDADYPMGADAFRRHLAEKAARYRERLDERMKENRVAEAKQAEARKRLQSIVAKIDRAADKACADGKVTLDEGKEIRALSKQLRDDLYRDLGLPRSKGE